MSQVIQKRLIQTIRDTNLGTNLRIGVKLQFHSGIRSAVALIAERRIQTEGLLHDRLQIWGRLIPITYYVIDLLKF